MEARRKSYNKICHLQLQLGSQLPKDMNKCADVRLYEIKPDAAVTNSYWHGLLLFSVTDSAALITFHRIGAGGCLHKVIQQNM